MTPSSRGSSRTKRAAFEHFLKLRRKAAALLAAEDAAVYVDLLQRRLPGGAGEMLVDR